MSEFLEKNKEYAEVMKEVMKLRHEPVAIKLVKEGEEFPEGYNEPTEQQSHCQAIFRAKDGASFKMPLACHSCMVGASALNMVETSDKIKSGEFHAGIGMHDTVQAAGKMITDRKIVPFKTIGEIVCPLKDADFEPDVVAIDDIPERIYWIVPLTTAEKGGRVEFSTSPFQCACEDVVAMPVCTGLPNISLGCFGCRKKTDMRPDEMACGIPYNMIPGFVGHLKKYNEGVMQKAKRE
ncbi:DUF169 domain-containing protein [Methanomassiliicoccales archaeon LGM-RCC1]|jgi:uncharacterized protein (DUF169 family)|nr:DUF169 domain-containing protein [Candidatus Methanomethylophilaceae archaeon]WII07219.1 DUF169 domain-containing protein [Methanomassiliicoccales archaeon LGM-RCC1]